MKQTLIVALAALACSTAFAQAPAGTTSPPSAQTNPTAAGGTPAAKAETRVDTKKAVGSTLSAPDPAAGMGKAPPDAQINPTASGGAAAARADMKVEARTNAAATGSMDTNGDGMVSKKEWDRHHSAMWSKMKRTNGMVPMAELEAQMKGGPN